MSTISESSRRPATPSERFEDRSDGVLDSWPTEPPAWLGDVAAGVEAWTHGTSPGHDDPGSARSGESTQPAARRRRSTRQTRDDDTGDTAPPGRTRRGRTRTRRTGDEVPADLDTGPAADPESVARTILLDQLTGRARSRAELRAKLDAKEVPAEISEQLLDRFTEVGLVDDAAFARAWVEGRHRAKGLAPRAIAMELRRKGVEDEVAREALEQVDEDSQREAATALVRKKLRSLSRVDRATATRRLVGMLARKGYSSGLCWSVVKDELDAAGVEDPEEFAD